MSLFVVSEVGWVRAGLKDGDDVTVVVVHLRGLSHLMKRSRQQSHRVLRGFSHLMMRLRQLSHHVIRREGSWWGVEVE